MDIKAGINTAIFLATLGLLISLWLGIRSIQAGRKVLYFRLRQQRISYGWRMVGFAFGLTMLALFLSRFGEPIAYSFYQPSPTPTLVPTITLTPTITLSPTITLTPTITDTPSITDTPTITPTPFVPAAIESQFTSQVTPDPAVLVSALNFARGVDLNTYEPIEPGTVFLNPVRRIVGIYSYDKMVSGAQWTVLWYRDGQLIYSDTFAWDGSTGGYGYAERVASPDEWLPGNYEVQIFVGLDWKSVSRFVVQGVPDTSTATRRPTLTATSTTTRVPPPTVTITRTVAPSPTLTASRTPPPTSTRLPTHTPRPSDTPWPSETPTP